MKNFISFLSTFVCFVITVSAQNIYNNPNSNHGNKFEQMGGTFPTPNEYRTASGAPGPKYWQQRCDYDIKCELDEKNLKLNGSATVTYFNNSPDVLTYLWLQLDENQHSSVNNANYQTSNTMTRQSSPQQLDRADEAKGDNGYGFNILKLTDAAGKPLKYTVNKTMMRVELPVPLKAGQRFVFKLDWNYKLSDRMNRGGRGGYEFFPEDGNHEFTMAQWYPRLCVYSDFQGWQNHQFTGRGEFALTFGNFKVQMTVPADHVIGATGECQNYQQVLTAAQFSRLQKSKAGKEEVTEIVNLGDVPVVQLDGDHRLVLEHGDELIVLGDVRQDPLDGHGPLEALDAVLLGLVDLGHAPNADAFEQEIRAELHWQVQSDAPGIMEDTPRARAGARLAPMGDIIAEFGRRNSNASNARARLSGRWCPGVHGPGRRPQQSRAMPRHAGR